MGGTGSGRQGGYGADTTEDFPVLDIRWLKREGALKPGTIHQISHLRRGKLTGSIALEAHEGKVTLAYCFGRDGEEFETRVYDIHLTQTPCGLGGALEGDTLGAPEVQAGRIVAPTGFGLGLPQAAAS